MLGAITWAGSAENLWVELSAIAARRWGAVTLLDLFVGLAFVATWIAVLERRWWPTIAWILALLCLGNLTTLVYLMYRLATSENVTSAFQPSGFARARRARNVITIKPAKEFSP
jgi:hypothetical protein